ncbi:hypothetical protein HMPREF0631_1349 [Peptostreptococcus anaerobius 653-L]|uniref:Uncharacterized protein n=1 Tax=Peptostreptococcus anaerobius 653-L TaxID=596329 RepID=D3MU43_9FIRM|nr:hypothetical protein [Peptostreptococcus anaerobius]EFD04317.1 hypothetical protein HMPREF0631_1349 [Peptostreptococcus anaerobius 653-L]
MKDLIAIYYENEKELADELVCEELKSEINKLTPKELTNNLVKVLFIPETERYQGILSFDARNNP